MLLLGHFNLLLLINFRKELISQFVLLTNVFRLHNNRPVKGGKTAKIGVTVVSLIVQF